MDTHALVHKMHVWHVFAMYVFNVKPWDAMWGDVMSCMYVVYVMYVMHVMRCVHACMHVCGVCVFVRLSCVCMSAMCVCMWCVHVRGVCDVYMCHM